MTFSGLWKGRKYELDKQNQLCYAFDESRPWLSIVQRGKCIDFSWRNYCKMHAQKIGRYLKNVKYPKPDPEQQQKDTFVVVMSKRTKRKQKMQRTKFLEEIVAAATRRSFSIPKVPQTPATDKSEVIRVEKDVVWHYFGEQYSEYYYEKQSTKVGRKVPASHYRKGCGTRRETQVDCPRNQKIEKKRTYRLEKKKRVRILRQQREDHDNSYYQNLEYYEALAYEDRTQREFDKIWRTHHNFLSKEYIRLLVNNGFSWDDLFDDY